MTEHDPMRRIRDQMNLEMFLFGVPPRSMQDVPPGPPNGIPSTEGCEVLSRFEIDRQTLEIRELPKEPT